MRFGCLDTDGIEDELVCSYSAASHIPPGQGLRKWFGGVALSFCDCDNLLIIDLLISRSINDQYINDCVIYSFIH